MEWEARFNTIHDAVAGCGFTFTLDLLVRNKLDSNYLSQVAEVGATHRFVKMIKWNFNPITGKFTKI